MARHLDRLRHRLRAGRAALHVAPSPVPERRATTRSPSATTSSQTRCRCASSARSCSGTGVGSGGVHWNGQIWRFLPTDFLTKSHNEQRYGKEAVTDYDLTVQDWGVTYDELEPYYDMFDKLCGTSGKAGNLKGKIQPGGNPFEGPRSSEYPNAAAAQTYGADAVRPGRGGAGPPPVPASDRQPVAALYQSARARSSASAPTAASARSSAAATTPRPARRRRCCRT